MAKLITNPLKNDITVQFDGTKYTVKAEDSIQVSEAIAGRWKRVHGFLQMSDISEVVKEVEVKKEKKEEAPKAEEAKEEVKEVKEEKKEVKEEKKAKKATTKNK